MTQSDEQALSRQWLTPAEVQEVTGYKRTKVYAALQAGELKGRQGLKRGHWRVHRAAVDAWITGDDLEASA